MRNATLTFNLGYIMTSSNLLTLLSLLLSDKVQCFNMMFIPYVTAADWLYMNSYIIQLKTWIVPSQC